MRNMPRSLMLFAAGLGTRMGALTATQPKPLIPVAGKPLIDHALALADGVGIGNIVVNLHYRAPQLAAHLADRPDIRFSDETGCLLDTGGGLRHALPLLETDPVFTLNSDAVWTGANALQELDAGWMPQSMDGLLLLLPRENATGHSGGGDFDLDPAGRLIRAPGTGAYVYLGAQIIRTDGLRDIESAVFSLNLLWDRMIAQGRLSGVVHRGGWCDVGRPEGIALAETLLEGSR